MDILSFSQVLSRTVLFHGIPVSPSIAVEVLFLVVMIICPVGQNSFGAAQEQAIVSDRE